MNDLISIIIPVYNVEKYIEKCIETIINQTYKNLEIILVDDGSTDNSGKICDEYKKIDNRIKVIHKKNGGLSDARNCGIDIASGKYIGFVDSDDYIDLDMYEILYKNIKESSASISTCEYIYLKPNQKIKNKKIKHYVLNIDKEVALEELLDDKKINNYAWNKLYKKELFKDIRYPIGKKFEDIGTTYLLIDRASNIICDNSKKYYYINRNNSISNTISENLIKDYIQMVTNMIEFYKNRNFENLEKINSTSVKYILNYHTCTIKGNLKEFYYNGQELLKQYEEYKNICKKYGILRALKDVKLKHKAFGIILYYNRDLAYKIGRKIV